MAKGPYLVSLRIALWWVMVAFQLAGESVIQEKANMGEEVRQLADSYIGLIFAFNLLYATVLVANFVARRYLVIEDGRTFKSFRLGVHLRTELLPDTLCLLLSAVFLYLGVDLLYPV